jgi:DNA-binding transcriptional LysR family regulator
LNQAASAYAYLRTGKRARPWIDRGGVSLKQVSFFFRCQLAFNLQQIVSWNDQMDRITAAQVFIEIAERGSFSAAGEALGMSRPMVTRYVAELEKWTGARLMQRTTRSLALTTAGEVCLHRCRQMQELVAELEMSAGPIEGEPKGRLRITTPVAFAQSQLTRMIATFLARHPQTELEVMVTDKALNLVEARIDLAIRVFSNEIDPGLIAKQIGKAKSLVVATPAYLEKHGTPKKIEDLSKHNCLAHSYVGKTEWEFTKGKRAATVRVNGNLCSNETTILLEAVLNHIGISKLPQFLVSRYLQEKRIVVLLDEWKANEIGIYGVYVSRKYVPPVMRAFLDFLSQEMKRALW